MTTRRKPKRDRAAYMRTYRLRNKVTLPVPTVATSVATPVTNVTSPSVVTLRMPRQAVDLVTLRRDIKQWVELHTVVEHAKVREQRRRLWDHVQRYAFFWAGVGFFAFLAFAAVG